MGKEEEEGIRHENEQSVGRGWQLGPLSNGEMDQQASSQEPPGWQQDLGENMLLPFELPAW